MTKEEILKNLYPVIHPVEEKIKEMTKTQNDFEMLCKIVISHFLHAVTFNKTEDEREKVYFFLRNIDEFRHGGVFLEGDTLIGVEP